MAPALRAPAHERALHAWSALFGELSPEVGRMFNQLGLLYHAQARYEEAEPLYGRALEILEKAPGGEAADVGTSLNNLASIYQAQGRYGEAEPAKPPVPRQHGRKALIGSEHPDVASSLDNHGGAVSHLQGRYEEAELLYGRALDDPGKSRWVASTRTWARAS